MARSRPPATQAWSRRWLREGVDVPRQLHDNPAHPPASQRSLEKKEAQIDNTFIV